VEAFLRIMKCGFARDAAHQREVVVFCGDWDDQSRVRGRRRAPIKKLTTALAKAVALVPVQEYHTSKACSCCGREDGVFSKVDNPVIQAARDVAQAAFDLKYTKLSFKKGEATGKGTAHELVMCVRCGTLFNRDANACSNMRSLADYVVRTGSWFARPDYLAHDALDLTPEEARCTIAGHSDVFDRKQPWATVDAKRRRMREAKEKDDADAAKMAAPTTA
jgi:hypothetical protein